MRVFLLIQTLNHGGSERQLVTLARELERHGQDVTVGVFYQGGALESELIQAGVRVASLDKRGRWDIARFLWRIYRTVRRERPDVLYSVLPTANLVAVLVKCVSPELRVVWGLRATTVDLASYDWVTRLSYWLERALTVAPGLITVNSYAGRDLYSKLGYPTDKMVVIPNGLDSRQFVPDVKAGRLLRQKWGVKLDEILIEFVARIDPMKDHPTFLQAVGAEGAVNRGHVVARASPDDPTTALRPA